MFLSLKHLENASPFDVLCQVDALLVSLVQF